MTFNGDTLEHHLVKLKSLQLSTLQSMFYDSVQLKLKKSSQTGLSPRQFYFTLKTGFGAVFEASLAAKLGQQKTLF